MIEIIKELPFMIAIISIAWLAVIAIALLDIVKRKDIANNTKTIWVIVGLIPLLGILSYGIINFKRNKKILIATILASIISLFSFWYFAIYEQENNRTDVTNMKGITKNATQLVQEFLDNEEAANQKYLQKENNIIEVTGTIEKLESDETGTVVYLNTQIENTSISARLQDKIKLQQGNTVSIKGLFTGFILGQIQLSECKLITSTNNKIDTATTINTTKKDTPILVKPITKDTVLTTIVEPKNYKSTKAQIRFFSKTPAENIEASNTQIVSTISSKGNIQFAALIKGFRFENELMQKHFNEEDYLYSDKFPKSEYKGSITNFNTVTLNKDGNYLVTTKGSLTLHGVTKQITATGNLIVKGNQLKLNSVFKLHVQDYNIDGSDVAEQLEITIEANYQ
ncbi:MAG: YceI family protein [Chitinophagaceae bacterium]|nr:YceI family protein [Chitinophagaceae bacterium]MBP9741309.1 YceI family protein [Chitinophagaceae bacterium]